MLFSQHKYTKQILFGRMTIISGVLKTCKKRQGENTY